MTENYYIIISYNKIGQVIMVGIIWPNCFQDHNLMLQDDTINEEQREEIRLETLETIRKHVSSSSDRSIIKSQFSLNDSEAEKLSLLVEV